jgi:uncharacterized membrane protein YphA (DoxX/SURF4 family)
VGAPLLAYGVLVVPLCAYFVAQLTAGIAMVHAEQGWFVVGLGRNGVEYSVLLVVCLVAIATTGAWGPPDHRSDDPDSLDGAPDWRSHQPPRREG